MLITFVSAAAPAIPEQRTIAVIEKNRLTRLWKTKFTDATLHLEQFVVQRKCRAVEVMSAS